MHVDSGGLQVLDPPTCLDLLATAPVGRIVFTDRALPAIQPVNFVLHEGEVVIRTSAGSKLTAAARGTVVAFEADQYDPDLRSGWSVVIIGHARVPTHPDELTQLRQLPLTTWAPGTRDSYIRIRPEMITGRRIPTTN